MSDDPYLAMLTERARKTTAEPPAPEPEPDPEPEPEESPPPGELGAVAFWQSDVAAAHIRRRVCGDRETSLAAHFGTLVDDSHRVAQAVSLRAGDPSLEAELLRRGACRTITFVDDSAKRLEYARSRVPEELRERTAFELGDPLSFAPAAPLGLVVANSVLHRFDDPEAVIARVASWLSPGGLAYVDEFVGPDRFQWSDAQIETVNRLLDRLPDDLRVDLTAGPGERKTMIGRPDPERFSRDHPHEAVASSRIRRALDEHLVPIEVRPYGGAVFHQLFARIMGNFADRPEIVELILEFDAILTDYGFVDSDYLWAAYAKPG